MKSTLLLIPALAVTLFAGAKAASAQEGYGPPPSPYWHQRTESALEQRGFYDGMKGADRDYWNHRRPEKQPVPAGKTYNSIGNIAEFFASRGKKFNIPKVAVEQPTGKKGFRPGQHVRHPKYGEGIVYQREGEGDDAKITVQFPRFGLKKLVEKYAQLEKA